MKAELKGADTMKRALQRFGEHAPAVVGQALYAEANSIMAASQPLVPVDTGALRSSGHVQAPVMTGSKVTVVMGYGGAAAPYAGLVHEKLSQRHASPTRAKYLEEPFRNRTAGMLGRIAGYVRQMLAGTVGRRGTG